MMNMAPKIRAVFWCLSDELKKLLSLLAIWFGRVKRPLSRKRPVMLIQSLFRQEPILWPLLAILAIIYIIPQTPLANKIETSIHFHMSLLPELKVDFHPSRTARNRFSTTRTALYIETRNDIQFVTPLLLHMTQVVPPEWRFVFLGTETLVAQLERSTAVQRMVEIGKLRLGFVERWKNTWKDTPDVFETQSRLLTNASFYDEQLPGVESLLYFRSSSIVCANSHRTINDYLEFDWVGAPWNINDQFGGNGGLSLRRVSKVKEILRFQTRLDGSESEDRWLSKRIGLLPNAHCANASIERGFSVEDIAHETPLGYHINPGLSRTNAGSVWDTVEKRKQIFSYCPEIKIIMSMRLERERCPVTPANPAQARRRAVEL